MTTENPFEAEIEKRALLNAAKYLKAVLEKEEYPNLEKAVKRLVLEITTTVVIKNNSYYNKAMNNIFHILSVWWKKIKSEDLQNNVYNRFLAKHTIEELDEFIIIMSF